MYFEKFYEGAITGIQDPDNTGNDLEDIEDAVLASHDDEVEDANSTYIDYDDIIDDFIYEAEYNTNVIYNSIGLHELNEAYKPSLGDKIKNSDFYINRLLPLIEGLKKIIAKIYEKIQEIYFKFAGSWDRLNTNITEMLIKLRNLGMQKARSLIEEASKKIFIDSNGIILTKRIIDKNKYNFASGRDIYTQDLESNIDKLSNISDIEKYSSNKFDDKKEIYDTLNRDEYYKSLTKEVSEVSYDDIDYIDRQLSMEDISYAFNSIKKIYKKSKSNAFSNEIKKLKEYQNKSDNNNVKTIFQNYQNICNDINYTLKIISVKFIIIMKAIQSDKILCISVLKEALTLNK